ncbi:MAG: ATP-binding protein [Candidatus Omnitrophica bacterium]|nr:ATP-binding protein [Candidatus Omnitrophota bacterium]
MPVKINFKLKLIFSYITVILVSFGFIAFFLDKNLEENSLHTVEESLVTQAHLVANQIITENLRTENTAYLEALAKNLGQEAKCLITIINPRGKVLADSEKSEREIPEMENHLNRPEVQTAMSGNVGIDIRYSPTLRIDMLYVALGVRDQVQIAGILRLALPLRTVQKTLFTIRKTIFMGLLFALVFAFIIGSILAARTIKPINRMIQISRKFSEGDFSRRITGVPGDEIGELAATLNKMAQDIEDNIREIKTQNQELAAIFNSMIEGIIVIDKKSHIVSVNSATEKIFGIFKEDMEGKIFIEAIRNNDISEIIKGVLREKKPVSKEINLLLPVRRIFQINATPTFDNDAVSGCLVVIHDITEIRRLETVRRDFVANVSHELKTPLTSIKGFIETLLEGAIEDKEHNRGFLKIIQDHAERLNKLVDDLLSLSSLESKEIAFERNDFNLRQQVEKVISGFESQIKRKGIEIKNELPADFSVAADKDKIEQVFTNLIDNAIKFNREKGLIRIYSQEINGKTKITIEDSGIGIPGKDIPRIFERFYRVDKARSRELGGTGLGLSIVRHIVESHGGTAGVESVEGLGSKFWFILQK